MHEGAVVDARFYKCCGGRTESYPRPGTIATCRTSCRSTTDRRPHLQALPFGECRARMRSRCKRLRSTPKRGSRAIRPRTATRATGSCWPSFCPASTRRLGTSTAGRGAHRRGDPRLRARQDRDRPRPGEGATASRPRRLRAHHATAPHRRAREPDRGQGAGDPPGAVALASVQLGLPRVPGRGSLRPPRRGLGARRRSLSIGAAVMASQGQGYRPVLAHYYPGTTLATLPD